MKKTHKTKSITCRIVSKGIIMQVNTIDEILSPGHYKIDACGVTASDGFPDGVEGECLSAYLEVSDTNHSADNLKSAAVGQTLTYTDADGSTAVYHRSGTNKQSKVEWSAWSDTAALGLQAGSITADKLSKDVRTKIESPLRPLFIAAGAEYNDSGVDNSKTAPWGETVTHKAGHYYLNGLGDITEEQMMKIYSYTFPLLGSTDWSNAFRDIDVRTNLFYNQFYATQRVKSLKAAFYNAKIEILSLNNSGNDNIMFTPYDGTSLSHAFILCKQLKAIIGILDARNISVGDAKNIGSGCDSLIYARVFGIKGDFILFNTSKNINKESVLYTIQNATPSSAITITLHTDAYSRLADDADILAALAAQPFVSLVSA